MYKVALLDSDILTYRIGFATKEETNELYVAGTLRSFITDILLALEDVEDYECFLSGSSEDNFRHQYAVTQPYKGNRKGSEKPKHFDFIRKLLVEEYNADVSVNEEADDTIAIRATELGDDAVIVSLDKDFDQVVGWHYNFAKKQLYYVTPEQAPLNFYRQFLEGDRVDNILGAQGIGKLRANQLLDGKDEDEMFQVCVDKLGYDRAVENGRLLYLRRKPNEIWEPPNEN